MTKQKKILSGIGALAALIACYFIYEHLMYVTTDNAQIDAHFVMIAGKVGGYVNKVNVVEGQKVKRGDLLIQIDDRDYQNTLKQIKGELQSSQARKTDAENNFRRIAQLYEKGAVSKQQYENSQAGLSEIRAKFDAVSAQVSQAELNLENTNIKAPFDGFVAKKSVEQGQLAAPGIPLIGFVDATERWVTANFKETDLTNLKVGSIADVEVDAIKGHDFTGKIESISAATGATFSLLPPDNATGNFTKVVQRVPVKIKLESLSADDVFYLKAGLSAEVKVHKH